MIGQDFMLHILLLVTHQYDLHYRFWHLV